MKRALIIFVGAVFVGLAVFLLQKERVASRAVDHLEPRTADETQETELAPPEMEANRARSPERPEEANLPPPTLLEVVVVNEDGQYLEHSKVTIASSLDTTSKHTDKSGKARMAWPSGEGRLFSLFVESAGYCPGKRLVSREDHAHTVVVFRPTEFKGRVTLANGDSPGQELMVLAWPMELTWDPPVDDFYSWVLGETETIGPNKSVLGSRTSLDGSFTLSQVNPKEDYYILAGGPGLVSEAQPMACPQGESEMTLVCSFAFGSFFKVTSGAGHSLDSQAIRNSQSMYFGPLDGKSEVCNSGDLSLLLAAGERVSRSPGAMSQLCIFRSPTTDPGRCLYHLQLPGCEAFEFRWTPKSLALGVETIDAILPNCAKATGSITVTPTGASLELISLYHDYLLACPQGNRAKITLINRQTDERLVFGASMEGLDFPCLLTDVPVGHYAVQYMHVFGGFTYPTDSLGVEVFVLENQDTTALIDFSECAQVELKLITPQGDDYSGNARWAIGPGTPNRKANGRLVFPATSGVLGRPPFLSGLLRAGDYTAAGFSPPWVAPPEQGHVAVDVEKGKLTRIRVQMQQ